MSIGGGRRFHPPVAELIGDPLDEALHCPAEAASPTTRSSSLVFISCRRPRCPSCGDLSDISGQVVEYAIHDRVSGSEPADIVEQYRCFGLNAAPQSEVGGTVFDE